MDGYELLIHPEPILEPNESKTAKKQKSKKAKQQKSQSAKKLTS